MSASRWITDLDSPAATERLVAALAPLARAGDVIALKGGLGAGKTAFARAFIMARMGPVEVPSPTFNLVLTYDDGITVPIWHFDLYRIGDADEIPELGLEEALAEAVTLIEWPERLGDMMPESRLEITLASGRGESERRVTLDAPAAWAQRLAPLAAREHWRQAP